MLSRLLPKTGRLALSLALVLTLMVIPVTASATDEPAENAAAYAPDRVLVGFKPGTPAKNVTSAHAALGAKAQGRIPQIGVEIVEVPKGKSIHGLIKMYEKNPNVAFAEPDYTCEAALTPNDEFFGRQGGVRRINAPAAWDVTTGVNTVTIAILDTGIDLSHPDIAGRIVRGYDFINSDSDPSDDHGHGTRVAGIAAATGNNSIGVAGVDWQARIMPVKVLGATGSGSWSVVAQGITFAADNGARVINMSLGGPTSSLTLHSAVKYAYGRGSFLAAATGNDGAEAVSYPARYPEVMAVGSADAYERLSSFSNFGEHMDVVAPGESIDTISMGGTYGRMGGTSAAAPFATGVAALMLSTNPALSPSGLMDAIRSSARDLGDPGWDKYYGWGHLDAAAALAAVSTPAPTDPEPIAPPVEDPAPAPDPEPTPEPEPVADPQPEPTTPVDTIAPVVSISSPADGSTVSGLVTIRAEAGDDVGVVRVEFYVNGSLQGTSTSPGYSTNWNTKKLSGEYTLTAIAYDAAGNAGTSSPVKVTVGTAEKAPPGKNR